MTCEDTAAIPPGPWEADASDKGWFVSSPDRFICALNDSDGPGESIARLISAAPDLQKALTDLLAHCSDRRWQHLYAYERAVNALAKSRGANQ